MTDRPAPYDEDGEGDDSDEEHHDRGDDVGDGARKG